MINECNVLYDTNDIPKINFLRSYKDCPVDNSSVLSQLKYIDKKKNLKDLAYEQIYVMSHNMDGSLKAFMCVGSGDYDHCDISFRNVGMFLLLSGAEKATLLHNHPENVKEQSEDDKRLTERFENICNMFSIGSRGSFILSRSGITQIPIEYFYDWRFIE